MIEEELAIMYHLDEDPMLPQDKEMWQIEWDDNDSESPPSSQPRSLCESENTDKLTSDLGSKEDLLAEFDVEPEEKDFLIEILGVAPKDEVEMLQKARETKPDTVKLVEDFAKSHPIYEQREGEIDEEVVVQFQRDVYDFARATRMKRKKAKMDARHAVAAWINYVGLDDSPLSMNKPMVKKGMPHLTFAEDYYLHKDNRLAKKKKKNKKREKEAKHSERQQVPAEDEDGTAPVFVDAFEHESGVLTTPVIGEKRSRAGLEDGATQGGDKERNKKRRRLKSAQQEVREVDFDRTSSTVVNGYATEILNDYHDPSASNKSVLSVPQTPAESAKSKKIRPRPSPTTSAYFTCPQSSLRRVIRRTGVISPDLQLGNPDAKLFRRARQERRHAAKIAPKMEQSKIKGIVVQPPLSPSTAITFDRVKTAEEDTDLVLNRPQPQQTTINEVGGKRELTEVPKAYEPTVETVNPGTRQKRKRKRNRNRLNEAKTICSTLDIGERGEHHYRQQGKEHCQQEAIRPWDEDARTLGDAVQQLHYYDGNSKIPAEVPFEVPRNAHRGKEDDQSKESQVLGSSNANFLTKRKRGDRGRPPRLKKPTEGAPSEIEEQGEPLAKISNVNANGPKRSRGDGDQRRRHSSLGESPNGQQTKDRHS